MGGAAVLNLTQTLSLRPRVRGHPPPATRSGAVTLHHSPGSKCCGPRIMVGAGAGSLELGSSLRGLELAREAGSSCTAAHFKLMPAVAISPGPADSDASCTKVLPYQ